MPVKATMSPSLPAAAAQFVCRTVQMHIAFPSLGEGGV